MKKRLARKIEKRKEQIRDMLEKLTVIAIDKINPDNQYWIRGWNEGLSYCCDCAVNVYRELIESGKITDDADEYDLEYDYCGNQESDSMEICEKCGRMLYCSVIDVNETIRDAGKIRCWEDVFELSCCNIDWDKIDIRQIRIPAWMRHKIKNTNLR